MYEAIIKGIFGNTQAVILILRVPFLLITHGYIHHKIPYLVLFALPDSLRVPMTRLNISDSDMVTITDGEELATRILGRYVGGSSPFKLFSTTPDLTVTFHSDPAGLVFGKGEGFIINYMGENWKSSNLFITRRLNKTTKPVTS